MSECNCFSCRVFREKGCMPGFPKMLWLRDGVTFNSAFFARDLKEFKFLLDELSYIFIKFNRAS